MGSESRRSSSNRAQSLVAEVVRASRVVVARWGPPWSRRRLAGEPLGVWMLVLLGLVLPAGVGLALFSL
jgi:hypothetical protein